MLATGPAVSLSYGPHGARVIGRNTTDIARWKRYRGGTTGQLWVETVKGEWHQLIDLGANVAAPLWLGRRIYFVSDHEGVGNLYSCTPTGDALRRHTHHEDFYVRHPATDGQRVVYHAGADLYLFDPAEDETHKVPVEFYSSKPERKRKFVPAEDHLQDYALQPAGKAVLLTTRGQVYSLPTWEGAAVRLGRVGARAYGATCLHDGRVALVSDAGGEDALELHYVSSLDGEVRLDSLDVGRPYSLTASPTRAEVAVINHRNELLLVDLEKATTRRLDLSHHYPIQGVAWSPDGRWLAYGCYVTAHTSVLKIYNVETGEMQQVTDPVLWDGNPAFDPEGKYLYFVSYRVFDPVYDNLHLDLGFPKGGRPYLITLQADLPSPFDKPAETGLSAAEDQAKATAAPVAVDLTGIRERIVAFPVAEGVYTKVRGLKGKVLFSSRPVEGALADDWFPAGDPPAKDKLELYDFATQKCDTVVDGVTSFEVSGDATTLAYRVGNRLRVVPAGEKLPEEAEEAPGRKSAWLDHGRVKVEVVPQAEWAQMFRETWRRQRDHFWTETMSGVNWQGVFERYAPLLTRVATRSEVSDLLWEMQGELGTSHAYELGGDHRPQPTYQQGFLGADLRYEQETDGYVIENIVRGDTWDPQASSPLQRPGLGIVVGDRILAVGGRRVDREVSPSSLLVNQADTEVQLSLAPATGSSVRQVTVKPLRDERPARYRDWVEHNRARVHHATDGRIGYLHVPDMGPHGYAEFHRGWLGEASRDGLVIDVRYNGGGHVSELLLEKLARVRRGYFVPRWGRPQPQPDLSFAGPLVAITNEFAGSDGDIFSHSFKLMKLGPLVGKRTWGGVVGISRAEPLSDGSIVTQPEFAYWFTDVGWQVENFGTEPTIEVDIRPQDDAAGEDPQLERAIQEALALLEANPVQSPAFGDRPHLAPPPLPRVTEVISDE